MLGNSSLGASCGDLADFGHCADLSLALRPKSAKNSTTSTANTRICDLDSANQAQNAESALDSAFPQNLVKNNLARSANPCKSFCYFLLLQKVESPSPLNLNPPSEADSQNLTLDSANQNNPSLRDSARNAQNRGNPH